MIEPLRKSLESRDKLFNEAFNLSSLTEKLKVSGAYLQVAKKLFVRASGFANPAFDNALARCRADQHWQTRVMNCGHDIMVDQPAELSALLERLA